MSAKIRSGTNIRIDPEVHKLLVAHVIKGDRKIGRFAEMAIKEKIEREQKSKKSNAK